MIHIKLWHDERVIAKLKELWAGENLSASEIARELGPNYTRNAIIGKARRLNLASHAHLTRDPNIQRRAHGKPNKPSRPAPPVIEPPAVGPIGTSAAANVCQFIKGDLDDPNWQMCGQPGFPWCAYHRSVVFTQSNNVVPLKAAKPAVVIHAYPDVQHKLRGRR